MPLANPPIQQALHRPVPFLAGVSYITCERLSHPVAIMGAASFKESIGAITCSFAIASLLLYCSGCSHRVQPDQPMRTPPILPNQQDWGDSDHDGIPNKVELTSYEDRDNFRRWFTAIAEMQFYRVSEQWNAEQRDCAGLVRFAWREALRKHDRPWFQKMGDGYSSVGFDVRAYSLETNPLGEKLFRTAHGAFQEGDLESGRFSEFADARTLKEFNCRFIARDRKRAKPGDLIFFHQPWVQKFPFHVMVFVGEARLASDGAADWVVYHTGSSPSDQGTIKKVRLSTLDRHPNRRWRPVETNPNFLGFYRLKILEQGGETYP